MERKLKAIRAGNRATVTRLLTRFEELEKSEPINIKKVKAVEEALEEKQKFLHELNDKLIDSLEPEDIKEEIAQTDEYMFNLNSKLSEIRTHTQTVDAPQPTTLNANASNFMPRMQTCNINTSATNSENINGELNMSENTYTGNYAQVLPGPSTNTQSTDDQIQVSMPPPHIAYNTMRLPKLDLPQFDGDVLQWSTFWDSFESTIHYNSNLTPIQKFSYLKSQIVGAAAQTIAGFTLTNAHYETAVELLRERYGSPQKIINAYMKALTDLPSPLNQLNSLRNYGDCLESYVRGLECLGQTQEMYGALLVPIIMSKLPIEIRKNIAREYETDKIDLKILRKAIAKEVKVLETGQFTDGKELHSTATFLTGARKRVVPKSTFHKRNDVKRDSKIRPCIYCAEEHFPGDCLKVTDTNERLKIVKHKKLCFNCLGNHRVSECRSNKSCKKCNKRHHTSICGSKTTEDKDNTTIVNMVNTEENNDTIVLYSTQQHNNVLLKTAIAPVTFRNQTTDAHILFDEGAQRSFISQDLAKKLQIKPTGRDTIEMSTFGDTEKNVRHLDTARIELQTDNGEIVAINALIVPDIAVPLQNQMKYVRRNLPYLKNLKLGHPVNNDDTFKISLLVGADYYWDIVQDSVIRGNGPTAVASKIGYLLSGPVVKDGPKSATSSVLLNVISQHHDVENSIEKFWNLESLGIRPPQQGEDENFLKTYQRNSIKFEDGHYTAKLPWKLDHPDLPSNIAIAKSRTENTIRRLSREPHLLQKYTDIIQDQEKRGFIEQVDETNDHISDVHYIPHHAIKKDSTTTPIRIVYDCSCKQSSDHASLNDCLMSVPPDLNDLTKILMRFRTKRYAISTDIEKAFLHVGLDENDRDYTRFFWLRDTDNPNGPLSTYRFKSVLFGATCSPFILNATLAKHLDEHNTSLSKTMKGDLYVDNILSSIETETETIEYFRCARTLMLKAGFNLRSWSSNCLELRNEAKLQNVLERDMIVKILGLKWDTETDTIAFQRVKLFDIELSKVTKREILSQSSRIYDPLGLLSPITVRAKILMQDIWKQKFEWDEPLPFEIQKQWRKLAKDLEQSTNLELNRQYMCNLPEQKNQLHVFVDASLSAYGATVYISNERNSSLVIAKNRVAPLKQLTLPQLELMAALIGARLAEHVKTTLGVKNVTFWSDSQIVLQWIFTSKQLKKFIRSRVEEIRNLTKTHDWKYCPTTDNPADLLTRGLYYSQFENNQLWFNGPKWILEETKWPKWNTCLNDETTVLLTNTCEEETTIKELSNDETGIHLVVPISRYSTLRKLLGVTAYVLRFVKNCRLPKLQRNTDKYITSEEFQSATESWIVSSQKMMFGDEIENMKSKDVKRLTLVKQLRLYLDDKGAIRCGGRIHNAPVCDNVKFPYLLPKNHPFTRLIVLDTHRNLKHAGVLMTVTQIRQAYWIPNIRQCVKVLLRNCVTCRKLSSKPYTAPDPPPLPKVRTLQAPPFTVTGVDYTGALYIKDKTGTESKVFICLFTCASTRAVHLEVVPDLTENSFLLAFRRFTSLKSRPKTMISDNASTYLAASETIKKLTQSTVINETLSKYGTSWTFIPKRAPWYGGWWERLVGLTKNCLRKTLGRSYVSLDVLRTIVTEIEATINDRPLTYVSPDISDEEPLTPSHLLYGRRITTTPYPREEIENTVHCDKSGLCKRFNTQTLLINHFWNRWKSEYLTALREFHRQSGNNIQTIKAGDVVQIQEDKQPRNHWNIAIVEELITGNDGLTRAAIIRTSNGRTSRPIVKLYPLEIHTNANNNDDDETSPTTRPKRNASTKAKENIKKWTTLM